MVTAELVNYIRGQISQGQNSETIKATLLSQKWNETDINEAFSQIGTSQPLQPTQTNVEDKKQANKYLIIGFFVWFGGNILKGIYSQPNPLYYIGFLLFLVGYGTFVYGCTLYSKAKGYSWIFGLLGLLNLIGLIVLAILPDKFKAVGK